MKQFPPAAIAAAMFAVLLGFFFGLYALMTRRQRRTTREIRLKASAQGWRYRRRRWQGDPTAFRIDGRNRSGVTWILTSGGTSGYDRGWTVVLNLRIPALGGEVDFAVLPRDSKGHSSALHTPGIPQGVESKLTGLSGTASSAIRFMRDARELPSGFPAFDAAYQVLALPAQVPVPPIDSALAERVLYWPADTMAPHSVLAWRDPFGVKFEARLPGPPDWPTVLNFLALAEDIITRLPAPVAALAPRGLVDRLIARFLGS